MGFERLYEDDDDRKDDEQEKENCYPECLRIGVVVRLQSFRHGVLFIVARYQVVGDGGYTFQHPCAVVASFEFR